MDPLSPLIPTQETEAASNQQADNLLFSPTSPIHEQLADIPPTSLSLNTNIPSENSSINLNSPSVFSNSSSTPQLPQRNLNGTNIERTSSQTEIPNLTSSTLFYDIPNNDPLTDMLTRHATTDHRRRSLSVKKPFDNREDQEAVYEMMKQNAWRSLAVFSRKQLINATPTDLEKILFLWFCRTLSLVKLKMHSLAAGELARLGDLNSPKFNYESYPDLYPEHAPGSLVPFELSVLSARLPGFMGNIEETINRLYKIIFICKKNQLLMRKTENAEEQKRWFERESQLSLMIVNQLIEMKDNNAATLLMDQICRRFKNQPEVWSALGRLYIQAGNLKQAQVAFKRVENLATEQDPLEEVVLLNSSYIQMAEGKWEDACMTLDRVLKINHKNPAAANNFAICSLYLGRIDKAIDTLETLISFAPSTAGNSETILFNLTTLFELRSENSLDKKRKLMVEVGKWAGDGFPVDCFKLN
ncbi:TPR-like protein [Basidiobolus meristosporus CBS 931.73]|uniref:TPR-like protein n=1 Tax=Basidiobolus meristosporus CBS 931.73 TaxID=1314790 RepID=A0A1Y1XZJ5_9FUNG|nr:TPR-like protein [Basidiobolus meristosporus CBS 931.73]|eukprot:ORX91183.1 TPR-like protein [Basidiobolus meristosporus CBS 931.73]